MVHDIYDILQEKFKQLLEKHHLNNHRIDVTGFVLSSKEAIGEPERNDFPLQKGKEKLVQACLNGFRGQAYTDMPGDFQGKLVDIANLKLDSNFKRAVFISSLNALMASLGLIKQTIHCKDNGPKECSIKLVNAIKEEYGNPKIALFGLQPAMAESLGDNFELRIFDLDQDNIGKKKFGVVVETGNNNLLEISTWADLLLVTGSTLANNTLIPFLDLTKPVVFYGTTIAGAAKLLNLKRYCFESC